MTIKRLIIQLLLIRMSQNR